MKKFFIVFLSLFICALTPITAYAVQKGAESNEQNIKCKSAILICMNTGDILFEKNADERLLPASVTKVMSILLFAEAIDSGQIKLTDEVSTSENAVSKGGSQIWLEYGEIMTVEELLKAIIISSANDACVSLGEYIAGSETAFVKLMNQRAEKLGLKNTNFENSTGLDDDVKNHYSSAKDLAVISKEVMKHKIVSKYSTVWLDSLRNGETELNNTNKLINKYQGITGLKTGTTSEAGFCLSSTATRGGLSLCSVVLGAKTSDERFEDSKFLLDYGFANYKLVMPEVDDNKINEIKVRNGIKSSFLPEYTISKLLTENGTDNKITVKYKILEEVPAPIKIGQEVGKIEYFSGNKKIGSTPLCSADEIEIKTLKFVFSYILARVGV